MKERRRVLVVLALLLVMSVGVVSAFWPFAVTGKSIDDYSSPAYSVQGVSQKFNGINQFNQIESNKITPSPTRAITVSGWFKTDAFYTDVSDIVGHPAKNEITGSWVSKRNSFNLDAEPDGSVKFWVFLDGTWFYVSTGSNNISLNTWEHWAGTWDGSNLNLYKNGNLIAGKVNVFGTLGTTGDLCIGHDCGLPAPYDNRYFQGTSAYVSIYSDALSENAVRNMYLEQKPKVTVTPSTGRDSSGATTPSSGAVAGAACEDSDGGQDANVAGTVTCGTQKYPDTCFSSNSVLEYYYDAGIDYYNRVYLTCAAGKECKNGACIASVSSGSSGSVGARKSDAGSRVNPCIAMGCSTENKCLPFGARSGSTYCALDGKMKAQQATADKCENNWQCTSNVCASEQCIDAGLMKKIIAWFRNFFGGLNSLPLSPPSPTTSGSISVLVVDENGKSISDSEVILYSATLNEMRREQTNAEGTVVFENERIVFPPTIKQLFRDHHIAEPVVYEMHTQQYEVSVQAEGYATQVKSVKFEEGKDATLDIMLQKGTSTTSPGRTSTLTGKVITEYDRRRDIKSRGPVDTTDLEELVRMEIPTVYGESRMERGIDSLDTLRKHIGTGTKETDGRENIDIGNGRTMTYFKNDRNAETFIIIETDSQDSNVFIVSPDQSITLTQNINDRQSTITRVRNADGGTTTYNDEMWRSDVIQNKDGTITTRDTKPDGSLSEEKTHTADGTIVQEKLKTDPDKEGFVTIDYIFNTGSDGNDDVKTITNYDGSKIVKTFVSGVEEGPIKTEKYDVSGNKINTEYRRGDVSTKLSEEEYLVQRERLKQATREYNGDRKSTTITKPNGDREETIIDANGKTIMTKVYGKDGDVDTTFNDGGSKTVETYNKDGTYKKEEYDTNNKLISTEYRGILGKKITQEEYDALREQIEKDAEKYVRERKGTYEDYITDLMEKEIEKSGSEKTPKYSIIISSRPVSFLASSQQTKGCKYNFADIHMEPTNDLKYGQAFYILGKVKKTAGCTGIFYVTVGTLGVTLDALAHDTYTSFRIGPFTHKELDGGTTCATLNAWEAHSTQTASADVTQPSAKAAFAYTMQGCSDSTLCPYGTDEQGKSISYCKRYYHTEPCRLTTKSDTSCLREVLSGLRS